MTTKPVEQLETLTLAVTRNRVVTLGFRITDLATDRLLQSGDDLVYLHGGYGGAFPKVEAALEGCVAGDRVELTLSPEEGYGQHDPALLVAVPLEAFGDTPPHPGEAFEGELPTGRSGWLTVIGVDGDRVILDGNHPYAGKTLGLRFEVLGVRESEQAERAAGFAFDGLLG